jgi:hypothetical protein
MPEPRTFPTRSELELVRALTESFEGSAPSQEDIEKVLESGAARVMLLEGRLREQASRPSGTSQAEELRVDHELVEEIRALREALAELRARTNPEGCAPLARGFVLRRKA